MFNGSFREAFTKIATFPEDNLKAFHVLLDWVYTNTLPPLSYNSAIRCYNWQPEEIYILADKLCIPELMDRALDMLRAFQLNTNQTWGRQDAKYIYSLPMMKNSPLRQYALDCMIFSFSLFLEELKERPRKQSSYTRCRKLKVKKVELNRDFLLAVSVRTLKDKIHIHNPNSNDPFPCRYHSHGKDEPCYLSSNKRKRGD
ncbi:hypothetical protein B7494_g7723 [Chlorociboria aeruginascens]|nr:hypothetical protein B7494_g7723 [Chlorociboria aeruginascens]